MADNGWLLYPNSELKGKMEYYIEPAEQPEEVIEQLKAITPTSLDPEEIKVLDPACGSGHILVEVYEVLREIYLERGYRLREIPELILTKNIYGLDIDDRAAQLAGFALMMKAREDDRRIFQRVEDGEVSLNVFSLQSTEHLDIPKLWKALDLEGHQQTGYTSELFDNSDEFVQSTGIYKDYFELLQALKSSFLQAKTLGSLIDIDHQLIKNLLAFKAELKNKIQGADPAGKQASMILFPLICQSIVLAQKYDCIIANPPYMGSNGMNKELKAYVSKNYSEAKSDLYSCFVIAANKQLAKAGVASFITIQGWMFLSSFDEFRKKLLTKSTLLNINHIGFNSFPSLNSKIALGSCLTFSNYHISNYLGSYIDLNSGSQSADKGVLFTTSKKERTHLVHNNEFEKISGSPIAYWLSDSFRDSFERFKPLSLSASAGKGIDTGDNEKFLRAWFEIESSEKWVPYLKGGGVKRWYGNREFVINWDEDGKELKSFPKSNLRNSKNFFKEGINWTRIGIKPSFRYFEEGFIFDSTGPCIFKDGDISSLLGYLNSGIVTSFLKVLSATLDFQSGHISKIPVPDAVYGDKKLKTLADQAIDISREDFNLFETSPDFKVSPLVEKSEGKLLSESVSNYFISSHSRAESLLELETDIDAHSEQLLGLDAVSTQKEISDITLLANAQYRYSNVKEKESVASIFRSDTLCELLSYCLGCMMGRYSLDMHGLAYAGSGNKGFKDLLTGGAYKSFTADDDGIIPLASEDWLFDDDATTRFKEFVKTVWGNEHLSENLEFVAESLCLHALKPLSTKKGSGESAMDTIRRYFSTQFFKDHCKTYKKRPIYWLFSSGKEKAFECLVYLHRYNEGTLSRMRTEYVTPLMGKYDAQHTLLSEQQLQATGTEARRIEKDLKSLEKKQAELRTFDEQLKHYAEKRITLDLDDGVKANYGKFGNLLADVKAIHGKAVK
ncbi:BREX-1 system adenine-specific DNA-methyltransferase PglX [Pseudoalteromonas sp. T1lg48]|uniref:BREX-1 system adenine-specific DNA-methyltransferase PglX n=1 Tax=Pseudoalteromonas sp. T1lg48 TaxID=2077100 RepID=UPI001F3F8B34|nr:BREX-1 system adenine-specific DNA-methyltransferase PglX [Pseudoalteromonas sp. T1lg48]